MSCPQDSNRLIYHRDIGPVWKWASKHIQKGLDRGSCYTLSQIHTGLLKGDMQLWTWGNKASLVTTIQTDNMNTFCLLLAAGGCDMSEWAGKIYLIEDWARAYDCKEMRIYGRRGWAKVLNYKIDYTRLSRQL